MNEFEIKRNNMVIWLFISQDIKTEQILNGENGHITTQLNHYSDQIAISQSQVTDKK